MNTFKIGDRIIVSKELFDINTIKKGLIGTIIDNTTFGIISNTVLVEFDKPIYKGHDGQKQGKLGHCWHICKKQIKPYKQKSLIGIWA